MHASSKRLSPGGCVQHADAPFPSESDGAGRALRRVADEADEGATAKGDGDGTHGTVRKDKGRDVKDCGTAISTTRLRVIRRVWISGWFVLHGGRNVLAHVHRQLRPIITSNHAHPRHSAHWSGHDQQHHQKGEE